LSRIKDVVNGFGDFRTSTREWRRKCVSISCESFLIDSKSRVLKPISDIAAPVAAFFRSGGTGGRIIFYHGIMPVIQGCNPSATRIQSHPETKEAGPSWPGLFAFQTLPKQIGTVLSMLSFGLPFSEAGSL
jgi:hypothetical protein